MRTWFRTHPAHSGSESGICMCVYIYTHSHLHMIMQYVRRRPWGSWAPFQRHWFCIHAYVHKLQYVRRRPWGSWAPFQRHWFCIHAYVHTLQYVRLKPWRSWASFQTRWFSWTDRMKWSKSGAWAGPSIQPQVAMYILWCTRVCIIFYMYMYISDSTCI